MQDKDEIYGLERLGLQFLGALRRGDPARLAELWHQAETDSAVEGLFDQLLVSESEDEDEDEASASDPVVGPSVPHEPTMPTRPIVVVRHRPEGRTIIPDAQIDRREEASKNAGFIT